jgi:hypothetical protein
MDLRILGEHVETMALSLRLQTPTEVLELAMDEKAESHINQSNIQFKDIHEVSSQQDQTAHTATEMPNITRTFTIPRLTKSQNSLDVFIVLIT